MKTIVVTGIGDTRNNGCWAMAASAISSIREAAPIPVRFIILTRKDSLDAQRLAFEDVEFVSWPWSLLSIPKTRLLWFLLCATTLVLQACQHRFFPSKLVFRDYWRAMSQADLVLDLSGDSISSAYSWVANLASIFPLLIAWLIGKPYYLCAQSIGPFGKGLVDRLAIDLIRSANLITVRENRSMEILAELRIVDNVQRTQDLAFLLVPSPAAERQRLLDHEGIDTSDKWVGVSVSSIIAGYAFRDLPGSEREEAYLGSLAAFCDELFEFYGFRTLFVPHVTIPNGLDDDRGVTAKVKQRMRHGDTSRIIGGDCTGAQLKALIGVCQFFFGSRMHATIGALSQGIPTLTLVYNHKTLGINGDVLGQHDYLIDIRGVSSVAFASTLSDCFHRLVANAGEVRASLQAVLPSIREGARENAWLALDFLDAAGPLQQMLHPWHCTGCGTCAAACPEQVLKMRESQQGTLRPGLRGRCTGCRRCDMVCPALGFDLAGAQRSRYVNSVPDPILGTCLSCRTGHATDPQVRFNGSSGGLVSAVAGYLLESGRVDAVLVVAADPENPFTQRARWAKNTEEIRAAQGSRYLPAAANEAFAEMPVGAQRLAVVGLPCHLWGVHLLEKTAALSGRSIDWRLGLFCGRTPTLLAADTMLASLGATRSETTRFTFRGEGWPGISRISTTGKEVQMPLDQMWSFVGSPFFTSPHCFCCPDFFGQLSDLSFGDAWLPECSEDTLGTSLVLARTQRAADLLDEMGRAGCIVTGEIAPQQVESAFSSNIRRKQRHGATKAKVTGEDVPVTWGAPQAGGARVLASYRYDWTLSQLGLSPALRRFFLRYPATRTMRILRRVSAFLQGGL